MPRGVYDRYPAEITEYILDHASPEITRRQMVEMIHQDLGIEIHYDYVKAKYLKYHLPAKTGVYEHNRILTDEQSDWLVTIIQGRTSEEIRDMLEKKFGVRLTTKQIRSWKKNHKTPSGFDTKWRKGQRPWCAGKTWDEFMPKEAQENSRRTLFKKGNIPANQKPLGTITQRKEYLWIKVREGKDQKNWMLYQRYIWEQANGPVPDGYRLCFLDGNPLNCKLENLALLSVGVLAVANKSFGMTNDAEINKTILKAAELKIKISAIEKKGKEK